jgi:hypothetical protein
MKGVNPQGTYRHRVPTLTLMGLALHGPAWAGGPHTHTPTRWILITCSLLTFKYPEISNVHIIDWPAIPYFFLMAKKKTVKKHVLCTGYLLFMEVFALLISKGWYK